MTKHLPRSPHHRFNRSQIKSADRAYHISRVIHAIVVFDQLLVGMRWTAPGSYSVSPALVSKAKAACADALPYAKADEEGYQL